MWLTPDRIMFGTDNGVIMVVENGDLRQNCIFRAVDVIEMSLKKVDVEYVEMYFFKYLIYIFQYVITCM